MKEILHIISISIAGIGAAVIVWGVLLVTFRLLKLEISRIKRKSIYKDREIIRHQLGSYLLLGLEFLISADIIETITHPTLKDMGILGSIVVIRTIISHFIEKEVEEFEPPVKE